MHSCSVFRNACVNVPVDPVSKMPKTAYERNEKTLTEQCSIESSCGSVSADIEAEKLKDFYRSIPDYNDINHLSEAEFYSTLRRLRDKKKLMLGLAVEHIDHCIYDDRYENDEIVPTVKKNPRVFQRKKSLTISEKPIPQVNVTKASTNRPIRKTDGCELENLTSDVQIDPTKTSLSVKGVTKMDRPKRNHSACSISWHDDKLESTKEIDEKFDKFFEENSYDDDGLYKTQSMPSSPLRTRRSGSRRRKSITIPKPFKMTERDEEDRIVNELRGLQKSMSEDMLHQKRERKRFRAKPVPIESRIPLYDRILEDQAMRRAITKINSEAELRAQMKPFSFTKREEASIGGACERAASVLPKCKKKKRFRARPVPKNLFSNYFYDKIKEDNFFRSMNRRVRAEEMLRNSRFPGSIAVRDRSRLSTPAAHSDLPRDPSPAVPSVTSSDRQRCSSPTKEMRKSKAKEDFITTSPQPFKFNTAERASKKMIDITKKIYEGTKSSNSRSTVDKSEDVFNKTQAYSALDLKGIAAGRSNLAALFRAEAVRQKFEMESARRMAEQRRRSENRQRDRLLRSKPAWHLVKNNHEEDIAMRLQTRRDEERMRREEFLHEMELMYGRVQQQPMLFERYYAPRSGATTVDSIQLSPRKSPSKKKGGRKSKVYNLGSPSISPELRGDIMKYLDKKSSVTEFYDGRDVKENSLDSLERN
ncbi:protein FAM161A [Bicyclus anynana]|uniref:Protein FAM161A n=1 Tax=Bicyclus anynana TaxID=110368 RepID=A0A6J1P573_BICAN|nr:protein FAM161A [Bicyclus anynana]